MQPNANSKQKETSLDESRGIALYNSDADDWTFVSSASSSDASRVSSNSSSPERGTYSGDGDGGGSSSGTSLVRDIATSVSGISGGSKQQQTCNQATQACAQQSDSTTSSDHPLTTQQPAVRSAKKHISHHKRKLGSCERADDADDESDGMTEINLSDNNDELITVGQVSGPPLAVACTNDEIVYDDVCPQEEEDGRRAVETGQQTVVDADMGMSEVGNGRRTHEVTLTWRKPTSTSTGTPIPAINGEPSRTPERTSLRERARRSTHSLETSVPGFKYALEVSALVIITFWLSETLDRTRQPLESRNDTTSPMLVDNNTFDSVYLDPTNHAHTELKLMHEEMIECIRRENPNRKEIEHWLSMGSQELDNYHTTQTNIRPFKGLVCYQNEVEWRKRFNKLKSEFSLDLRKITRQIKRKITNEVLEKQHPAMSFRLILNQLEYLDHIDQRRKDRILEKLKAENLDLVRRLSKKTSSEVKDKSQHNHHHQEQRQHHKHDPAIGNSLIILESENVRLKHEIESLKARLAEKAGTVYIKQSLELEKCDRENNALKQFHQQVAHEVARNLKQLDRSNSVESLAIFEHEHDESLSSRLASTRASLLHLGEGITKLIERNKMLESELSESQSLNEMMLTDAKNLIEDANQTKVDAVQTIQDQMELENMSPSSVEDVLLHDPAHWLDSSSQQHQQQQRQQQQIRDFRGDWLMKRAKLREKLRKASRNSEPLSERQSPVTRHHTRHAQKLDTKNTPSRNYLEEPEERQGKHHRDTGSADQELRKRRHRPYKYLTETANSYNHNSQKNCKYHLRRDEL